MKQQEDEKKLWSDDDFYDDDDEVVDLSPRTGDHGGKEDGMKEVPTDPEQVTAKCEELLQRYYGYSSFRPSQLEAIRTALEGRDQLIVMSTGMLFVIGCAVVYIVSLPFPHFQATASRCATKCRH